MIVERGADNPMLPLSLFRSRQFTATNAVTFLLYAAIGGALLLLVIGWQTVSGFSPLQAGAALLPVTVVMLALAGRFGALSQRYGPRLFIGLGPMVAAAGLAAMTFLTTDSGYWTAVLPAVTVFGLGLAIFVAPLTSTVLGCARFGADVTCRHRFRGEQRGGTGRGPDRGSGAARDRRADRRRLRFGNRLPGPLPDRDPDMHRSAGRGRRAGPAHGPEPGPDDTPRWDGVPGPRRVSIGGVVGRAGGKGRDDW